MSDHQYQYTFQSLSLLSSLLSTSPMECNCSCYSDTSINNNIIHTDSRLIFIGGIIIGCFFMTIIIMIIGISTSASSSTSTSNKNSIIQLLLHRYWNRIWRKTEEEKLMNQICNGIQKHDNDDRMEILKQSLILFTKQVFENDCNNNININDDTNDDTTNKSSSSKVVNYLSPKEMAKVLFYNDPTMDLSKSLSLAEESTTTIHSLSSSSSSSQSIISLFQQIQEYSVHTNHPLFFNQLFGSLDPVALAAELIALSTHTSSYTWETAPVFTLLEREVFVRLGKLVFECHNKNDNDMDDHDNDMDDHDHKENIGLKSEGENHENNNISIQENHEIDNDGVYNELINNRYDGLMLPGGSLSNLTAIHVARHYSLHGTQQNMTQPNSNNNNNATITTDPTSRIISSTNNQNDNIFFEEKKDSVSYYGNHLEPKVELLGFVSSEAHYSFAKAASVTGIGIDNLISVPTLPNGQMDVGKLDSLLSAFENGNGDEMSLYCNDTNCYRIPFFVAATAGSTVRGSFDDIDAIVNVCKKHEVIINRRLNSIALRKSVHRRRRCKIWVHVDGAWGGSAIFSSRSDMKGLMNGIHLVDSFTFNPHKLLGAPQQTTAFISRHGGILKAANSSGAKYLFDGRKNGAECDLGDSSYTCGRKPDAIKLWALWKYYGSQGIGRMVERKADSLLLFARMIQVHESFMLACTPWPFNVNFFFLPERIRRRLQESGVDVTSENPIIPDEISKDIAIVSVNLKLKLHRSGEMLIPYQPLSNQNADCFRLVLAGNKVFSTEDFQKVIDLMLEYGSDL